MGWLKKFWPRPHTAMVTLSMIGLPCTSYATLGVGDFSSWVFYSGKTQLGTDFCSVSAATTKGPTGNVSIKQLANDKSIKITLYSTTWRFPVGASVPVTLDFSDQQPLLLKGYGDGKFLDIALPTDAVAIFLSLMGERSRMRLQVGGSANQLWAVSLVGIKPELKAFASCSLTQDRGAASDKKSPSTQTLGSCKDIRFTGLAAIDPGALDMASSANDPEDYVARNPILCSKSYVCRGLGYFKNQRATLMNEHGDYAYIVTSVDFNTGRRDLHLAIFRADAKCDGK